MFTNRKLSQLKKYSLCCLSLLYLCLSTFLKSSTVRHKIKFRYKSIMTPLFFNSASVTWFCLLYSKEFNPLTTAARAKVPFYVKVPFFQTAGRCQVSNGALWRLLHILVLLTRDATKLRARLWQVGISDWYYTSAPVPTLLRVIVGRSIIRYFWS